MKQQKKLLQLCQDFHITNIQKLTEHTFVITKWDWEYDQAHQFQKNCVELLKTYKKLQIFIFCSHPHCFTHGRGLQKKQGKVLDGLIKFNPEDHQNLPYPYYEIKRGGGLTFHYSGQFIIYPIVNLTAKKWTLPNLMDFILQTLKDILSPVAPSPIDIKREEKAGLWLSLQKFASLGFALERFITYHGLALNLDYDQAMFQSLQSLNPCGLSAHTYTSFNPPQKTYITKEQLHNKFIHHLARKITMPNFPKDCHSLLSRYLTDDIFNQLQNKKTKNNYNFNQLINSGLSHFDSGIGVYAGDKESYDLFSPLMNPIIYDYHQTSKETLHRKNLDDTQLEFKNLDPQNKYILSTRIRVARNLANTPLGAAISDQERLEVEDKITTSLKKLPSPFKGQYFPLTNMSAKDQEALIKDHFLFKKGDRFLEAAGLNRHWPNGRGIFHNQEKNFLVWINEEDQMRIISMEKGGDLLNVFKRLTLALTYLEEKLEFSYSPKLGYITSCPSNLGTAMRASVHIQLSHLPTKTLNEICQKHHLQIRGIHGEHSESENSTYDISNKRRLGLSEVEALTDLYQGVKELIAQDKDHGRL